MQLTAAAVTPPAEHAVRRPAGEAGAAAADTDCYTLRTNNEAKSHIQGQKQKIILPRIFF
jgi:hypothetical protein